MHNPEPTSAAEPRPDAPPAAGRRRRWPIAVAVVAMALALVSLTTLRTGQQTAPVAAPGTAQVDLAALAKQSPLAVPLYQGLSQQQGGAAAPAAAGSAASAKSVEMKGYKFNPASLTIAAGDTVTWTNHDTAPHNVVVTDGPEKFSSPTLQTGGTFSHTFTKAGTYSYYCSIHPDMKATVTVQGATPPAPPSSPTAPPSSSSTPTAPSSPTHPMPMPTDTPPGNCVPKDVLQPILDHIKAAHLEESPGQQATDLLNLDQYIKTHTVWLESVLKPAFDGSADKVVTDTLAPIIAHIKAAHLEESPGQQVTDLLNLDQYIKTHTVWLENVLTPLLNQASC
ncbi:cupredoxin domain-containing protein [Amycolatopsis echigonensis]|uniref:Cupredoxin family copper-binding protein n=1 Tax=Amycolatopsis echigonensis TaxID=2576905 RepID=A0A8E2BA91_9PSEU|nr:cupredoxin family copper-binding protein [Amycolatopsis echigonensis]MBB2506237.1 cupredoxin family copper-binding protein [Amycolatopsis echigonensis]